MTGAKPSSWRSVAIVSSGNFLEMYDFMIFGFYAAAIAKTFFPTGDEYAGLMLTPTGPRLVEFNARFGDPEFQVLMLRLKSDLVPLLYAAATGTLDQAPVPEWHNEAAICVVLAASGYPDSPKVGSVIRGAGQDFGEDVKVFHAGTVLDGGDLNAAGGRVLNVCARGATLTEARTKAYAAVDAIDWPEGFHRRDIGWRAL